MVKSSVSSRKTNIFRISKFKFWNSILAVLYTRAISVPHISEYMEKETNQHVFGSFKTELFPVDKLIVIQSFGINCRTLFDVMKRRFSVCVCEHNTCSYCKSRLFCREIDQPLPSRAFHNKVTYSVCLCTLSYQQCCGMHLAILRNAI